MYIFISNGDNLVHPFYWFFLEVHLNYCLNDGIYEFVWLEENKEIYWILKVPSQIKCSHAALGRKSIFSKMSSSEKLVIYWLFLRKFKISSNVPNSPRNFASGMFLKQPITALKYPQNTNFSWGKNFQKMDFLPGAAWEHLIWDGTFNSKTSQFLLEKLSWCLTLQIGHI